MPDYERPADRDTDNVYQVTVVASDGAKRGTLAVTVTVTDVNEGPEITGDQSLALAENTATDRVLASYTGRDPEDPSAEITRWSVAGRDGGDFTINEGGQLTFRNPPDHEGPADSGQDNVYEITVRASDGRMYGAHDVTVTVTPVDEPPEFRSGSRTAFSYRENGAAALYTYRATDPEGAEVAWSVSGADRDDFEISKDGGVLAFREPPDHDEPADDDGDNVYEVTVVATDRTGHAYNLPVTVTVTDANEGPVIADTGTNTAITVPENHDQVLATYTATDPEDQPVTRWSVTGRDGGDFTINEAGELTFRSPPDHERPADSGRDNVYEVTVRASDGRYYGTLDVVVRRWRPWTRRPSSSAIPRTPSSTRRTAPLQSTPTGPPTRRAVRGHLGPGRGPTRDALLHRQRDGRPHLQHAHLTTRLQQIQGPQQRVRAYGGSHATGPSKTARREVTVTVTNLTDARAVVRGTAQVGETLTAETSGIADKNRRDQADFSYQWLADGTDVEGATDRTYEVTEKDEGKTIKVRVKFTGSAGKEETLTSAATEPVQPAQPAQSNEPATGRPAIDGTAQVGETLRADASGISDADGMTNAVFRYQWTRWDGDTDEDIEGASRLDL